MNTFKSIQIEGGLFSQDLLEKVLRAELPGQNPQDFGIKGKRTLTDEIASIFNDCHEQWKIFQRKLERQPEGESATSITRDSWMIPFFSSLGYDLYYNQRAYEVDGSTFHISHRAGIDEDAPPIHIVSIKQELGKVSPTGRPRLSPHSLLQEFLNRTDRLWGIVTNGIILRVLRESTYIRKQAYLEFDLREIFEEKRFSDFVVLYRLLHRTRLPKNSSDAKNCLLEQYFQHSLEQGSRVREHLRDGVEECLRILANGFLSHQKNSELRKRLSPEYTDSDRIKESEFYRHLLRLVYRFIFLLTSEERGLISSNPLYLEHYGISRFKRYVDSRNYYTEHDDLWCSLRVLWKVLSDQSLSGLLQVSPLNGELFEPILFDSYTISNRALLDALWHLIYYQETSSSTQRKVNYAHLDVEELGSVYESLLEYHPSISYPDYTFDLIYGSERKSTGSYYTPPELVSELINSALVPVIEEKLKNAKTKEEKEKALLSIKVCDPASGSGHFLLAAARKLGKELARIRTEEDEPAPESVREAIRDVVAHCIYGVDKNPLAVELCRVALWLEAHCKGKPLTFLDHKIKCGDSLVGILDLNVLKEGIPDDAFSPTSGDERNVATQIKRLNREQLRSLQSRQQYLPFEPEQKILALSEIERQIESIPDDSPENIRRKKQLHNESLQHSERLRLENACNLWTASFFQPLTGENLSTAITTKTVFDFFDNKAYPQTLAKAEALASENRFFHWALEFSEVFAQGGFDVVLGNPPWERIKLQEKEFFESRDRRIAQAPNAAVRRRLINNLPSENPELWREYQRALRNSECTSKFLRESGLYPLTGRGDINTYSVFAERMRSILREGGRLGIIVPTGIATDDTNKNFFGEIVQKGELVSLYDFENRKKFFPSIHGSYKFCLFTVKRGKQNLSTQSATEFAFFCHDVSDLRNPDRIVHLTPQDLKLINPNTKTVPIFRSRKDAELTKYIYRRFPVLINEESGQNPWKVEFMRMFDMANDSHLFRTKRQLEDDGYKLSGNIFIKGSDRYLPLYEAKMVHHFNHRFGDFADHPEGSESTQLPEIPLERLQDPNYVVLPRYWVPEAEVERLLSMKNWKHGWLLGWRNVTNVTNERTVISTVIPLIGVGNSYPVVFTFSDMKAYLVSILSAFVFDYIARQKIGNPNLNFFIIEQFPILPPETFISPSPWNKTQTLAEFCKPRLLELVYTAWDLKPFAEDLGYYGEPFKFDPERRFILRAELDGAFFHLYLGTHEEWKTTASRELKELFPTPRDAVDYILEQFPIVKRKDEEKFGEYRTKRVILEIYDKMNEAIITGSEWKSELI